MKLTLIAGARPNFMKIAPIIHAIKQHYSALSPLLGGDASVRPVGGRQRGSDAIDKNMQLTGKKIEYRLVHTGQHYDQKMSETFF